MTSISSRTIISNDKGEILLVREANSGLWSMPGGWADLYDSPSKTAKNESMQEAGADIDVVRLIGILNRTPFKADTSVPEYVIIFEGVLKGELKEHEYETEDVGWFDYKNLPQMSRKVSSTELERMINAAVSGDTIFD